MSNTQNEEYISLAQKFSDLLKQFAHRYMDITPEPHTIDGYMTWLMNLTSIPYSNVVLQDFGPLCFEMAQNDREMALQNRKTRKLERALRHYSSNR